MYSALDIAKYIITFCFQEGKPVSNLKLQKMLYFLQATFLVIRGKPLFREEMLAWQYGPVVPEVYYDFCMYGGSPIFDEYENTVNDQIDRRLIDQVLKNLMMEEPWDLVNRTHIENGPWDNTINENGERSIIPKQLIRKFYENHRDELPNGGIFNE